ncbi:MAG: pentapeptide repeat-containing protein [Xenococcaceae cyanobacterium]
MIESIFKISAAEIRKRHASGERNFKKADLSYADLRGADLSYADLRGANLSYANLQEADLSGSDLRESILNRAKLNEANLSRVNLIGANLTKANLNKANLIGAYLTKACLKGANLMEACLENAHLNEAHLNGANLKGASLVGAYFIGTYLMKANLSEANLSRAYLSGADLSGAYYSDSTRFDGSFDLINTRMQKVRLTTVEELLSTFNYLSECSNRYLGSRMTAKYFESSRPDFDWLNNFKIDRSAQITFSGVLTEAVSSVQLQWFQKWVNAFIKCCSQIIQDFPTLIDQKQLVITRSTSDLVSAL